MVEDDAAGENEDGPPKNTSRTMDEEPRSKTVAELLQLLHDKEEQAVHLQEAAAQREAAAEHNYHEQEAHIRELQTQLHRAHQEITALAYDNERFQTVIVQTVVETLAQLGITRRRRRRSNSGGRTRNSSTSNKIEEQQERQQRRSISDTTDRSNSRVLPVSKPNIPRSTIPPAKEGAAAAAVPGKDEEQQPRLGTETKVRKQMRYTGDQVAGAAVVVRENAEQPRLEYSNEQQRPTTNHDIKRKPMRRQDDKDPVATAGEGIPPVSDNVLSRNTVTTTRTSDTITTKDNRSAAAKTSTNVKINFLLPLPYPDDWTLNMLAVNVMEDDTDDEASLVTVQKHDESCALTYTGPSSSNQFVACVPTITPSDTGFYWKVTLTTLPRPTLRGGSPCEVFIGIINTAVCGVDDVPSTKSWESSGSNGWKNGYSLSYERGCRQNRHPTLQAFDQGDTLLFGVTLDTFCMYSMFRQEQYCIYLPTSPTLTTTTPPSTSNIPEHYIHFNFSTKGTKVVLAPMDDEERKLLHP